MDIDLASDLRAGSGAPLYRHVVMRLADDRWFWYQRYHHLLVDGFSFTAIARRVAAIYTHLCRGDALEPTPFTAFSDVVAEYELTGRRRHGSATPISGSKKRGSCRRRPRSARSRWPGKPPRRASIDWNSAAIRRPSPNWCSAARSRS